MRANFTKLPPLPKEITTQEKIESLEVELDSLQKVIKIGDKYPWGKHGIFTRAERIATALAMLRKQLHDNAC